MAPPESWLLWHVHEQHTSSKRHALTIPHLQQPTARHSTAQHATPNQLRVPQKHYATSSQLHSSKTMAYSTDSHKPGLHNSARQLSEAIDQPFQTNSQHASQTSRSICRQQPAHTSGSAAAYALSTLKSFCCPADVLKKGCSGKVRGTSREITSSMLPHPVAQQHTCSATLGNTA